MEEAERVRHVGCEVVRHVVVAVVSLRRSFRPGCLEVSKMVRCKIRIIIDLWRMS